MFSKEVQTDQGIHFDPRKLINNIISLNFFWETSAYNLNLIIIFISLPNKDILAICLI